MTIAWTQSTPGSALAGRVLFGTGWGVAGFYPGPARVVVASGMTKSWIFGAAMPSGMALHDTLLA